jgi:hypothetical protein
MSGGAYQRRRRLAQGSDVIIGDNEWLMGAIGFSVATVLLVLAFAFRGRFTAFERLGAGMVILVIVVVAGLLVFAAAMAGFSGIK